MIGSVRSRLTLAVALVVGGLAVAAALVAPRTVRDSLVDDRLDAEVDREQAALADNVTLVSRETGRRLGAAELTTVFGPQIAELTQSLDDSGTLDRLRSFDDDGRVFVAPLGGIVGTVDRDGTIRVDQIPDDPPGPLVTVQRLEELSVQFGRAPMFDAPFELFADGDLTFEEFVAELDARFGSEFGDRLDLSVFDDIPGFDIGDAEIPSGVLDALRDELFPAPPDSVDRATPTDVSDHAFGVRTVGELDVIVSASTDGIDRSVERVRNALWLAVPIAMLLGGIVTWLLAGRALRPVRAITEQTARIRSSTLHERVPVPRAGDEIAALATEMNTMLDRVQREDERRRQFVADASHELRSPLAAIRTQAESAIATVATDSTDDDQLELAEGVLAEAERMSTIVDDLLSLARHDEELAPPGVPVDLDDIVLAEASRPRRVPVAAAGVSAGQVRGRADELARVVTHLLDNAARHAESRVAVGLESIGDHVLLTVEDDGPGIPVEHRSRVFERFVRLDEARHRDSGGAGLGLAVVASVVRAGGGEVTVGDSELGGARFAVVLPAAS